MGIIGCGSFATTNLRTIEELQSGGFLELVAVCDLAEEKARFLGEKCHVPYFTSVEKMLEKEMDFVYIATSDYDHHITAKLAAEHGKSVLVEKPFAMSLPCCDIIINACRRADVHFEVAENYWGSDTEMTAQKIISQGTIGEVIRTYAIDPNPSAGRAAFAGHSGAFRLHDMGSHRMSEIRRFAGSDPKRVVAKTRICMPEERFDDWGHAVVEFQNGVIGICEVGVACAGKINYREIVGRKGTITMWGLYRTGPIQLTLRAEDNVVRDRRGLPRLRDIDVPVEYFYRFGEAEETLYVDKVVVRTDPPIIHENPYSGIVSTQTGDGFAACVMSIIDACVNNKLPVYGIQGRKDIEMCVAMYESSRRGMSPITLPIEELTSWEKELHELYNKNFGKYPTDV